jgi:hypothetical protein
MRNILSSQYKIHMLRAYIDYLFILKNGLSKLGTFDLGLAHHSAVGVPEDDKSSSGPSDSNKNLIHLCASVVPVLGSCPEQFR